MLNSFCFSEFSGNGLNSLCVMVYDFIVVVSCLILKFLSSLVAEFSSSIVYLHPSVSCVRLVFIYTGLSSVTLFSRSLPVHWL